MTPEIAILCQWLRSEIALSEEAIKVIQEEAGRTGDLEAWDSSRIMHGQVQAYERTIQHAKGLSEREFQLAKKKGTL